MIKQALDAMDRATPGPWMMRRDDCHFSTMTEIYSGDCIIAEANRECDTPILAAAPDMAAWIKKALPYMKFARACVAAGLISTNKAYDEKELDALIKEATE